MTIKLPSRTREDMLREWDDEFSQEDREAVASVLLRSEAFLRDVLQTSVNGGLDAYANEVTREMRLMKLARQILAFDPDKGEP